MSTNSHTHEVMVTRTYSRRCERDGDILWIPKTGDLSGYQCLTRSRKDAGKEAADKYGR